MSEIPATKGRPRAYPEERLAGLNVTLKPSTIKLLDDLAQTQQRTRSALLRAVIEDGLDCRDILIQLQEIAADNNRSAVWLLHQIVRAYLKDRYTPWAPIDTDLTCAGDEDGCCTCQLTDRRYCTRDQRDGHKPL